MPFYTPGNLFAGGANGDKYPRDRTPYFNKFLFTALKLGQFGNTCRDFFVGPGLDSTDLAIQRYFHFHEAQMLQFRAEAFNTFNHTQFGSPSGSVTSSGFGKITSASNPRVLQLAFKYNF